MPFSPRSIKGFTGFAVIWMAVTFSLVTWWWIHGMSQPGVGPHIQNMLYWEGLFLVPVVFLGGAVMVYLTYHHQTRHDQLQVFFSTFAHDLKTSITRLRLQAELLEESGGNLDPKVRGMLKEIQRLDLQLENSLWMAQLKSGPLLMQNTTLRDIMEHLRNEFSEVRLELSRDAEVIVDRRAFTVILRNLFQNSLLHGKADRIELTVHVTGELLVLEVSDNGQGVSMPVSKLGKGQLTSRGQNSNGLGLYLSRRLMERMNGRLDFSNEGRFLNILTVKGRVL